MGFRITEFHTEPHTAAVAPEQPVAVILGGHWVPIVGSGRETISLTVLPGACSVSPSSVEIEVAEVALAVRMSFNLTVSGPIGAVVKVTATSSENDRSFFVELT